VTTLAASSPEQRSTITHFLLRRLHSLTGILFGGYVVVHLLINATLIEGTRYDSQPTVYQLQVDKIHSLPFLKAISLFAIILPIVYHTIWGVYVMINGRPNVGHYGYAKNWLYTLQRLSAVILIAFIAFHVLAFKGYLNWMLGPDVHFTPGAATQSAINHMKSAWWIGWVVYPIGIVSATFHLANGFWAAGIAWGLTVSATAQKRWGIVCTGLFFFTAICGFLALFSTLRGESRPIAPELPRVTNVVIQHQA
jgi:succinate dehydrogenase / fumarate reductase cytochrome b subunit